LIARSPSTVPPAQALEERHRSKQQGGDASGGSSDEDGSEEGSDSGDELDPAVAAEVGRQTGGMNRAIASLYGDAAAAAAPRADADGGADELAGGRPAFAPPEAIAAAAAARAAKEGPQPGAGAGVLPAAAPPAAAAGPDPMERDAALADGDLHPSTSGRAAALRSAARAKRGGAAAGGAASKRARTGAARPGAALPSSAVAPAPVTYAELGGIEGILDEVRELIEYPLKHPEVYGWLGVEPPRGVLLHGPPGCGKTALANAIANECGVPFLRVSAPEIVSGMSGESEAKIRQLFQEAAAAAPAIVFIDEIDAIAPKRETAQREMERRIVAQMLTCLDDLSSLYPRQPDGGGGGDGADGAELDPAAPLLQGRHVVVIGATNRPDSLDPALRRAGRFDREISLGIPSEEARRAILRVLARRLRLSGDFDFGVVARRTPGFVGADLAALMKEAAALAVKRVFRQLDAGAAAVHTAAAAAGAAAAPAAADGDAGDAAPAPPPVARMGQGPLSAAELSGLSITMADFEEAVGKVQPSVRREGFATTPDVTWDDVGSLGEVREELSFAITKPIAQPELFEAMGLRAATGVLLFGPPGCGKTLVAKAAAADSGANFISIKGPELLNKYVGESERAVRQLFARARAAAPCVLFFDEMDALAPRRGSDAANASAERLVNQLLTEMDGTDGRLGVYIVAATNRPDMIDPALLRPGRLDKVLYVPLPPPEGRAAILRALTRRTPLAPEVDLAAVGSSPRLAGFSGADLAALVREACVAAVKEGLAAAGQAPGGAAGAGPPAGYVSPQVLPRHFDEAARRVQPSVSRQDQRMYDALRSRLRSSRGHLTRAAETKPDEAGPARDESAAGAKDEDAQDMEGSAGGAGPDAEPQGEAMEG
jgi:ribosome biogenesis ATPase